MKHRGLILLAILCMGIKARGQTGSAIQPVVVIDGKNGSGPGEFAISRIPELDVPRHAIAVDDNEHIYILDAFNNRIQHYDQTGHWVGSIPIVASVKTTSEELRLSPMLPQTMIAVDFIAFTNGAVYAFQQRRPITSRDAGRLLMLQGGSMVSADHDTHSADIRGRLSQHYYKARYKSQLTRALAALGTTSQKFLAQHPLEGELWEIHLDKNKNVWAISSRGLHVYGSGGKLIYQGEVGSHEILEKDSALYFLSYPNSGVRVAKYLLPK